MFLLTMLLVAIGVGSYQIWRANKENIKLSNQLAASQKMEQETKSAYSIAAQRVSDLEASSKELQDKIEDRDETVAALATATLKLKDQLFKIKNAKQTTVDETGHPTEEQVSCDVRHRVDFEQEKDLWKIKGYCVTSPPESEVSISWLRPLQLAFVMTRKNGQYRLYLDSNSPDVIAVESLALRIDPSVFEKKWYQKLMVSADFGWASSNPTISARVTMDVGSFAIGPFMGLFNGKNGLEKSIGISVGYRPFN